MPRSPTCCCSAGTLCPSTLGRSTGWRPLLSTIAAPLGKFAVLGNHDRWNGVGRVTRTLEAHGIEVLVNENRRLPPPFHDIWVCGLDDYLTGEVDVGAALADAGGTRIVLMHAPDSLEDLAGEDFALAICGHTHGGQIAFRGGAPLMSAPGPLSRIVQPRIVSAGPRRRSPGERRARLQHAAGASQQRPRDHRMQIVGSIVRPGRGEFRNSGHARREALAPRMEVQIFGIRKSRRDP